MIKALISGIFKIVINLVSLLLAPIDSLISSFLPSLDSAFSKISSFFDYIGDFIPWVISYTGLDDLTLNIIIDIFVFILTVPLMVITIKLAIKWYDKLKM